MTKDEKIEEILTRGVATFVDPQDKFKEKLKNNPSDIIIKFGVDPTRPDIHLGHAVILQKLRKFQDLGCKVVFVVGDFTASIGDPTGKSKVRTELKSQEIFSNMETYLHQVGKILKTEEKYFSWITNSDWFTSISDLVPQNATITHNGSFVDPTSFVGKAFIYADTRMQLKNLNKNWAESFSLQNLVWILRQITYSRLIERDMFQNRIKEGQPLYMLEMLYPVLQGIDSEIIYKVYGGCDLEIGGTDQTFNMLMGRDVMKLYEQPEQAVMSIDILVGTDGKEKMSKSLDNYIGVTDDPQNMFGKIMSIPDSAIANYYKLCTNVDSKKLNEIEESLKNVNSRKWYSFLPRISYNGSDINPRDVKLDLSGNIVSMYYGEDVATHAREIFSSTFQKKGIPEDVEKIKTKEGETFADVLVREKIVSSKSDWRRLVGEGAVKRLQEGSAEEKITDYLALATPGVYKIGKRRFVKVISDVDGSAEPRLGRRQNRK